MIRFALARRMLAGFLSFLVSNKILVLIFRALRQMSCYTITKEPIRLIINVEAQNNFKPGYPLLKRAIYYCGQMLSAQYGTKFNHSHYEKYGLVSEQGYVGAGDSESGTRNVRFAPGTILKVERLESVSPPSFCLILFLNNKGYAVSATFVSKPCSFPVRCLSWLSSSRTPTKRYPDYAWYK